jgi:hypothetical protein
LFWLIIMIGTAWAASAPRRADNGRLSTPWQEVIFHFAMLDPIFELSSPARAYELKLVFR